MERMYLTLNKKSPFYQVIYYKKDGKRTTISTGTTNEKEAERFFHSFDPNLVVEPLEENHSIKLNNFADEYLKYVSSNFSIKYLNKAVKPTFKVFQNYLTDIPIENISTRHIDQFISSIAAKSKFSASLYYRTLKAAFNKAVIWNYIKENPFNKVKPPKVMKSYPAFINDIELQIIISNTAKEYLKPLFSAAFYTGMRLAELVNMKWSWIDFQNNIITVKCDNSFTTKNRKERIVPLNKTLRVILLNHRPKILSISNYDFIFSAVNGKKLNEDFVSKNFKKAVRKSNLNEKIHFHSLRHSFCSNLVQKGVHLLVVKDLAGHADTRMAQNYSHLRPENLHNAVNLL